MKNNEFIVKAEQTLATTYSLYGANGFIRGGFSSRQEALEWPAWAKKVDREQAARIRRKAAELIKQAEELEEED